MAMRAIGGMGRRLGVESAYVAVGCRLARKNPPHVHPVFTPILYHHPPRFASRIPPPRFAHRIPPPLPHVKTSASATPEPEFRAVIHIFKGEKLEEKLTTSSDNLADALSKVFGRCKEGAFERRMKKLNVLLVIANIIGKIFFPH